MCADGLLQFKQLAGFSAGILAEFGGNRFLYFCKTIFDPFLHSWSSKDAYCVSHPMSLVDMCNDYK